MIKYSRYNILSNIRNSENYFIVNLLTGNADILNFTELQEISEIRDHETLPESSFLEELKEKGYFIEEEEEKKLYRSKYLDFLDSREKDEIQIFFITNYSCNFACSYCYQDQYIHLNQELSRELIDSFFNYIREEFAGRKKYITLFGGEPLLPDEKQKSLIRYFIERAGEFELDICVVTNGYSLSEYADILKKGNIREIQVTLDGTETMHNKRRFLKGGGGTFAKIVNGIDECLESNIAINLRMVIDKENIQDLSELAQFAISKGWTDNPLFKTQIGRNYELHHCQSSQDKLFDRISLYEEIYEMVRKSPHILLFYKPAYSVAKFLSENGRLPDPLFDACPACKTEWAFDYTGKIYPCTATVGKLEESTGTFYPVRSTATNIINEWERRDVTSIPECRDCNLQLACGGGCGSVAKNKTGKICSVDCRPVKELMELGFSAYFKESTI